MPNDPSFPQDPERPDIQPMSRRATRILVVAAVVLAFAVSFGAMYYLGQLAKDPETQRRIQEIQEREATEQAAPDSAVTDSTAASQTTPPSPDDVFQIDPIRPISELREAALAATPPNEQGDFRTPDLVELTDLDSTIMLDVRYATAKNFMGTPFYREPRAFLQRPAAEALVRAHRALRNEGYGLIVYDAYRPWHVTKMFWDATPDSLKTFVASPAQGSIHNRGAAVDVGLYDLATGAPAAMPSGYDEFTDRAHVDYAGGSAEARQHRDLLRRHLEQHGFSVYTAEWWHYNYRDASAYPILNLTFDAIDRLQRDE